MSAKVHRLPAAQHHAILRDVVLADRQFTDANRHDRPRAVILAGQPGAGKGGLARKAKRELMNDVVSIDPDELRDLHPQVKSLRQTHPYTWSLHTQPDARKWAEELLEATVADKKNLIFDTTLGNGKSAAKLIQDLQARGYAVEVRAVAAHWLESELGVDQRFSKQLDQRGYGRHVPEVARDALYGKLPASLDTVHAQTHAPIRLFNREGDVLYDSRLDAHLPSAALEQAREMRLADPSITRRLRDGWREQQDWHRQLPRNQRVAPPTREHLLTERSDGAVVQRLEGEFPRVTEIDHVTRIRPTRIRAGGTLGVAGLALDAYDAVDTVRTAGRLREQGNATAAQAQIERFGSRSLGGWGGAAAGATAGAMLGVESGPGLLVTGALGGVVGAVAGDRIATWLDERRINQQHDALGNTWTFDAQHGWARRLPNDSVLRADPALADRLTHQASRTAIELALGAPPASRDPYTLPAQAQDTRSVVARDWIRRPDTGDWKREVVEQLLEHGLKASHLETARPGRAAQLDAAAQAIIERNAAQTPAAMAEQYRAAHARNGWSQYAPLPDAVTHALHRPGRLVGSDGNLYERSVEGNWVSDGWLNDSQARGNLRNELDATYRAWQRGRQIEIPGHQVSAGGWSTRTADMANAMSTRPLDGGGLGEARHPRHPHHPQHALYQELHARVPQATEERLLQFAAACHKEGMTARTLGRIHASEDHPVLTFTSTSMRNSRVVVDSHIPAPPAEASIQDIEQTNQRIEQVRQQYMSRNAARRQGHGMVI